MGSGSVNYFWFLCVFFCSGSVNYFWFLYFPFLFGLEVSPIFDFSTSRFFCIIFSHSHNLNPLIHITRMPAWTCWTHKTFEIYIHSDSVFFAKIGLMNALCWTEKDWIAPSVVCPKNQRIMPRGYFFSSQMILVSQNCARPLKPKIKFLRKNEEPKLK